MMVSFVRLFIQVFRKYRDLGQNANVAEVDSYLSLISGFHSLSLADPVVKLLTSNSASRLQ